MASATTRGTRALAAIGVTAIAVTGLWLAGALPALPSLHNPVKEVTVDRTGPAVLQQLSGLSDYHASTGQLQVTVDVEKDVKYVPSAISGERVIYQAVGRVDGVVDLSGLDETSVIVDQEGRVTVVLPHATLSDVNLDLDQSKIIRRNRGLLNRVAGAFTDTPTSERNLQIAAKKKLTDAAKEAGVQAKAEKKAAADLTKLLKAAGATQVSVRFADPAPSDAA